jgi:dUTP pyrophosphatase
MKVLAKTPHQEGLNYETPGAVGFDFRSLYDCTIEAGKMALIDTGTVVQIPKGYMLMLAPRSSTFKNFGVIMANSVGIIDQDYCGPTDTIKFCYFNPGNQVATIPAKTRIGQGVFVKIEQAEFELVETISTPSRGGFGTTGNQ